MVVWTADASERDVAVCPETGVLEIKSPGPDGEKGLEFSVV